MIAMGSVADSPHIALAFHAESAESAENCLARFSPRSPRSPRETLLPSLEQFRDAQPDATIPHRQARLVRDEDVGRRAPATHARRRMQPVYSLPELDSCSP